jgi:hypothetical protein
MGGVMDAAGRTPVFFVSKSQQKVHMAKGFKEERKNTVG